MRHTFPRDFYIPTEASGALNIETTTAEDAVIYTYTTKRNQLGAIVFHGKAAKPDWHFTFANEMSRARKIAEYIEGRKRSAEYKAEQRAKRSQPHKLTVGAILHTNWGYDQTNVEYFEVTRIVGPHTVELREIAQERTETGFMSGRCKPIPGKFLSPRYEGDDAGLPIIRRARADGSVRIDDVRDAWVGDRELYWSSYA
jgi:hypothetical protein